MCFPRYIQGNSNPRKFRFTFYLFRDLFQSTFIDRTTKIDRIGDNLNKDNIKRCKSVSQSYLI